MGEWHEQLRLGRARAQGRTAAVRRDAAAGLAGPAAPATARRRATGHRRATGRRRLRPPHAWLRTAATATGRRPATATRPRRRRRPTPSSRSCSRSLVRGSLPRRAGDRRAGPRRPRRDARSTSPAGARTGMGLVKAARIISWIHLGLAALRSLVVRAAGRDCAGACGSVDADAAARRWPVLGRLAPLRFRPLRRCRWAVLLWTVPGLPRADACASDRVARVRVSSAPRAVSPQVHRSTWSDPGDTPDRGGRTHRGTPGGYDECTTAGRTCTTQPRQKTVTSEDGDTEAPCPRSSSWSARAGRTRSRRPRRPR